MAHAISFYDSFAVSESTMEFTNIPITQSIFTPIKPSYTTPSAIVATIPIKPFPVLVKSMTGKNTTVDIHNQMTIEELKLEIENLDGIPPHQQRLVFNGKEMQDTNKVESYHLKSNDMIHIVLRLRGGMFHETSSKKDHVYLGQSQSDAEEIERLETMIRLKKYGLLHALTHALSITSNKESGSLDSVQLLWLKPTDYLPSP
jgi:hypothetical protein